MFTQSSDHRIYYMYSSEKVELNVLDVRSRISLTFGVFIEHAMRVKNN
jgi:hypothetical protein